MAGLAATTVAGATTAETWERMWAPYDEATYQQVLSWLKPDDIVLDIGAGDLRLARRMAARTDHVYAFELNQGLASGPLDAGGLTVVWGDAYSIPFPASITVGVLLMRHCRNLARLLKKLQYIGCQRLITNARWRVGVELIDLQSPPTPYASAGLGWYACRCGATGFIPGPAEALTPGIESAVQEVIDCPACEDKDQSSIEGTFTHGVSTG